MHEYELHSAGQRRWRVLASVRAGITAFDPDPGDMVSRRAGNGTFQRKPGDTSRLVCSIALDVRGHSGDRTVHPQRRLQPAR
jgi:hypothetical protein